MSERDSGDVYSADLPAGPGDSAAAVAEVADAWGAQRDPDEEGGRSAATTAGARGGRLVMPRVAGVHRGVLSGRLELLPQGVNASRAVYQVEEAHDKVHFAAVVILVISAVGALFTVIWPIWPVLLPIAPFGAILALGGWFLVISRLQNSGPEEFLRQVEDELTADDASGEGAG